MRSIRAASTATGLANEAPLTQTAPLAFPIIHIPSNAIALRRRRRARRHSTSRPSAISATGSVSTTHTAHRVLIRDATILVNRRRRRNLTIGSRINTNADPRHDAVRDIIAELHPLDERIHVRGLLAQDRVVGVEREVLRVGVVGRGGFDEGDQGLVEEDLADVGGVGGRVALEEGAVGADERFVGVVCEDVDVRGACWDTVLLAGELMRRAWEY